MTEKTKKGFTLVEFLLVVAIIGILVAIGLWVMGNFRAGIRDAKRVADIMMIRAVLDLYFSVKGKYPEMMVADMNIGNKCLSSEVDTFKSNLSECTGTIFIKMLPSNPKPRNEGACRNMAFDYRYNTGDANTTYNLDFCLGKGLDGLSPGFHQATPTEIK